MHRRIHHAICAALAGSAWLVACSKDDVPSPAAASMVAETESAPSGHPCALTSDAEVRAIFSDAKPVVRDRTTDKYNIATCTWDTPTNVFFVQVFRAASSAEDEARSRISGFVDPMKPGAGAQIRYDKVAGLGDDAAVVAVTADEAQGILTEGGVLAVRRGDRMAVLFCRSLIDGDRAATIKALEGLGRKAAARM